MTNDRDLLSEPEIRRALRLEADEMPPRVDAALIAAAERASRSRSASGLAFVGVAAFLGGWIWSEAARALLGALLAATGVDPVGTLIDLANSALATLVPIGAAASAPAIPIAIAVAAVIAALHERWTQAHAPS